MILTWRDYFKGRDEAYADELTIEIRRNAQATIAALNRVLALALRDCVDLAPIKTICHSGWRPRGVNDRTANSAKDSPHLMALAGDLGDVAADRRLARWALANPQKLWDAGIRAIERPQWTVVLDKDVKVIDAWLHMQTVAVKSGKFIFVPSANSAMVAALPGELDTPRFA